MSKHHRRLSQRLAAAAALLLLPVLGGCAAAPDWPTVDRQAFTIRAACERQRRDGLIATELATERCANTSIHWLYGDAGYPQMDVLDRYLARRDAIAAAVDRGTITAADAYVKLAEARTEQNAALSRHGLDPIVYDTAPYKVVDLCPRPSPATSLCN
jgi:hypothetical protein